MRQRRSSITAKTPNMLVSLRRPRTKWRNTEKRSLNFPRRSFIKPSTLLNTVWAPSQTLLPICDCGLLAWPMLVGGHVHVHACIYSTGCMHFCTCTCTCTVHTCTCICIHVHVFLYDSTACSLYMYIYYNYCIYNAILYVVYLPRPLFSLSLSLLQYTELSEVLWTMVMNMAVDLGVKSPVVGVLVIFFLFAFWAGELYIHSSLCII